MEIYKPFVGMRFSLHGVEFEVVFVAQGKVRYASNAGGRQYTLSTSDFSKIIKSENAISHAENNSINFTKENAQGIIKKHHYIKEALQELSHPTSTKKLPGIITKVSEAINDQRPPSVSTVTKWIQSYQKNAAQKTSGQ
jgi:putative transposase